MIKTKVGNKKFILLSALFSILVLYSIMSVNYVIDPFFQYRIKDNKYLLNPQFLNEGIIKNYDYNTAIIGSSMMQNITLSALSQEEGIKPIKLTLGGLNLKELKVLYVNLNKQKVKTVIINIDLSLFNKDIDKEENRFPDYLFGSTWLDNLHYLLAYETTVRYTPVDLGLAYYLGNNPPEKVPDKIKSRICIDDIGNFRDRANHNDTQRLLLDYKISFGVSYMDPNGMDERMDDNLKNLFSTLDIDNNPNINYIFILPPYSGLYWYHTRINNYYTNFIRFIHRFLHETEKYKNARIICFYDIDEIANLDNYIDITHFNLAISDTISNNILNHKYEMNRYNISQRLDRLNTLTNQFAEKYKHLLPIVRK